MSTVEQEYKYAFKLRSGSHHDRARGITIEPGEIFKTNEDMIKLHGRNRWEKIQDNSGETIEDLRARLRILESMTKPSAPPANEDDLENKSVKELRAIAASLEPPVDLTTCNGKTEIVNVIRQAMDTA